MYRAAQDKPWYMRPPHLLGDQDVLEALLASTEFSHVPVAVLSRRRDIAQCHGPSDYAPLDRFRALVRGSGPPPLIRAQGQKPWINDVEPSVRSSRRDEIKGYYARLHHELSPYTAVANDYRGDVDEDMAWVEPRTGPGRVMAKLSRGNAVALELPLAILNTPGRALAGHIRALRQRQQEM
jgi:hypothetical protein